MPATKLLVYVPSMGRNRHGMFEQKLKEKYGAHYRVEVFDHELDVISNVDLSRTVSELEGAIAKWAGDSDGKRAGTTEVILCGHSIGGLLARAAYLASLSSKATFPDGGGPWGTKVTRFVLIASPNAGFEPSKMPFHWRLAYGICTFPPTRLTIEQIRAGGYWIADLRFRWVEAMRSDAAPFVVQLIGEDDPVVDTDDVLDSAYMGETAVRRVPNSNHGAIVDLSGAHASERWDILSNAIVGDQTDFPKLPARAVSQDPVVFILHGIRASAHQRWVARLREALVAEGVAQENVLASNYGFFSAIQFALPGTRHRNVHRFLRDYGDKFVTHDADNFHFVGHSNGTYMMGRALEFVSSMRFHRILLAGSVLPPDYDWAKRFDKGQVQTHLSDGAGNSVERRGDVHNDRAKRDYPVGWLCSWLNGLHQDVGTAGYSGFQTRPAGLREYEDTFPPGHGSALKDHDGYPKRMPEVAKFLISGAPESAPKEEQGPGLFQVMSNALGLRPVAFVSVLIILALAGWSLFLVAANIGWPFAVAYYIAGAFIIWVGLRSI